MARCSECAEDEAEPHHVDEPADPAALSHGTQRQQDRPDEEVEHVAQPAGERRDTLEHERQRRHYGDRGPEREEVGEQVGDGLERSLAAQQVHRHDVEHIHAGDEREIGGASQPLPREIGTGAHRRRGDDPAGSGQEVAANRVAREVEAGKSEEKGREARRREGDDLRGVARAHAIHHHQRAPRRRVGNEHVGEAGQDKDQPERRRATEPQPEISSRDAENLPEHRWHPVTPPAASGARRRLPGRAPPRVRQGTAVRAIPRGPARRRPGAPRGSP